MKCFRSFLCLPLLFVMYIMVLLWPLMCIALALAIFSSVMDMVRSKSVDAMSVFWVIYFLFFLRMFLQIGCRREVLPAVWVHLLEKTLLFATPGKMLRVVRTSDSQSDVLLDDSWIEGQGRQRWLKVLSGHIRRSIDMTLLEELKSEVYGARDDDIDNPQHFLSGQPSPSMDEMSEVWTCHSSVPSFPAWYCWCESVPLFRCFVRLQEDVNVLGHVMLLRTNQRLGPEDVHTMRNPCASFVPRCIGNDKVVARRGYWAKYLFGNFPAGKPDAFIFKKDMVDRTGLKTVHTFRIVARI